jgi:shikimate dehydrogenase
MTLRLGVVGYPVHHSISPAIHQAALDALGIDGRYERWAVAPVDLPAWVATLRAPDALGASVTVPHKEAVIPLLDELDPLARDIGAVNTIVHTGGRLLGTNTDVVGFRRALDEAGYTAASGEAVMLGAGGAARAVGHALLGVGVRRLAIFNRDVARARGLAASLTAGDGGLEAGADRGVNGAGRGGASGGAPVVEGYGLDAPELDARLHACELLVNTTTVGMKGGERLLRPEQVPVRALVVDIIYTPPQTVLLADAAARGARTRNGLPMLVYQAAAQFERWTGRTAPVETMFAAARRALP